jgi:hypothetical protein
VKHVFAFAGIGDRGAGRRSPFVELTPDEAREPRRARYNEIVLDWFLEMGEYLDGNAWVGLDVAAVTGQPGRTLTRRAVERADDVH